MRLNWSSRQSPTDLDTPPLEPVLEFDIRRNVAKPGVTAWPEKYFGQRFGPSLIRKALRAGLVVVAEIEGLPYPIAIKDARWDGEILEVVTLEGPRIPDRLFTRKSLKGFTSSGLLKDDPGE
jgi:hypothetical protein